MSRNNDSGCGSIIVCIIGILVVLYVIGGFFANLYNYIEKGNKTSADAAVFFLLLICGIGWLLYKLLGKD